MASPRADQSRVLQSFRFAGYTTGMVRTLSGFKKSHHSVPDAVNSATSGFLVKLSADELAGEAEQFFQRARELLHYKRTDLSLDLANGSAVLSAKDFTFEINYALLDDDPAQYRVSRQLHSIRKVDFLNMPESDALFPNVFNQVVFVLTKGAPVEKVIDAVEGLEEDAGLRVDYPSSCQHCTLSVPDVAAEVVFDGGELSMVFPRADSPRVLWEDFMRVRHAFALTKDKVLAALVTG
jgi:hypothetical protein